MHGELFRATLAGRRVAAQHYPSIAELIDPAAVDLIAFGHDHRARAERRGGAWAVNPGTLMGYDPGADADVPASWAVYDAGQHAVAFWRLNGDAIETWEPGG
jgi:predicted phosphodiesterase